MKILYITNGDGYSGSSIALYNIIQQFGDDITCQVVFPRKYGDFSKILEEKGIKCYHLRYTMNLFPSKNLNWYRYIAAFIYTVTINVTAIRHVKIIAKQFKPDIIHTNVGPVDLGYKVARALKIPHVWHIREYMDEDFAMRPIPSLAAYIVKYNKPVNHCIAITKGILSHFDLRGDAVHIYDGVIPDKETIPLPKGNYFLFTGRLQEVKGDFILLNAFVQYAKEGGNVDLYFAGTCDEKRMKQLKSIVDNHNLQERVHFLGFRSDVYDLMSRAKALFVPSRFEGFGFITVEAMFNHCLVVGRNTAGTKEQFDNGLNLQGCEIGIRFEKNEDLPGIMHKIEKFDDSEIITAAYRTVRSLYTSRLNAEKVLAYYKHILSEQY